MSSFLRVGAVLAALLDTGSHAGPVAVRSSDVEVLPALQPRDSITLGSYSLATSHEKDVLFNLYGPIPCSEFLI